MSCKYLHKVTSFTVTAGTSIAMNFASAVTANDTERMCVKICSAIPSTAYGLPVIATVNGASVAVWNKYGNPMTGEELSKYKVYKGYYGATTPHILFSNEPCMNC